MRPLASVWGRGEGSGDLAGGRHGGGRDLHAPRDLHDFGEDVGRNALLRVTLQVCPAEALGQGLDEQSVGAGGQCGPTQGLHQLPATGGVGRVHDHGQGGHLAERLDHIQVQEVTGVGPVAGGANATLAEDDVPVSLQGHVLGGSQPRFSRTGFRVRPTSLRSG